MRRALAALLAAIGVVAPLAAQAETIAIVGGTVEPVGAPRIAGGTVLIRDGKIVAVGSRVAIPAGTRRIDARGKIVTPGFINAATVLGLVELGGESSTRNASTSDAISADFRSWDGFFSESAYIASTREDGITTVGIGPSGGFVSGQTALVELGAGTARDMVLKAPTGILVDPSGGGFENGADRDETAGGAPDTAGNEIADRPVSRGQAFGKLRSLLEDARLYAAHRTAYDEGRTRQLAASRDNLIALGPVVRGELPLIVAADRVDDIDQTLMLARDERVRVIIFGGAEAWRIAPRIAAAHVAVITGAMNNIPASFDQLNQRQENAGLLRRAGVQVVIVGNAGGGDEDQFNARNVRFEAGNAVAYGMSHDDALRAVTLAPATVFGMGDQLGSLAPGKLADVVIWSGDPFEFATRAEHVFVRGVEYRDPSRQDLLIERYRHLPATHNAPPGQSTP
jgi:imidazolonepropionase-like amidohydrolase